MVTVRSGRLERLVSSPDIRGQMRKDMTPDGGSTRFRRFGTLAS